MWICCATGCFTTRVNWAEPDFANPQFPSWTTRCRSPQAVERVYARALQLESDGCSKCVDLFLEVAIATRQFDGPKCDRCRYRRLHKSALMKLVIAGQEFGRLDPRSGLRVQRNGSDHWIPIARHGFVWNATDFHHLTVVGDYTTNGIRTLHRRAGVGIPLVVTRCSCGDAFLSDRSIFAATLQLSCPCKQCNKETTPDDLTQIQLELYDPLRSNYTRGDKREHFVEAEPIAKDISAPLGFLLRSERSNALSGFIRPGDANENSRLIAAEPYQPGKIPVVLIHGLFSDPFTWANMLNDLRAYPGFVDHFQLLVFEYPTGKPFLASAAELRNSLRSLRRQWDPMDQDSQLSNSVLVGHSMGGLIAKLQVTESGNRLWRSVAKRPFNEVQIMEPFRQQLAEAFFFSPAPEVSRVIFLGTPHRGSAYAQRCIGRIGASLVLEPDNRKQAHRYLIQSNPGAFRKEMRDRIPTSIDLLEPESPLLNAMADLPIGPCVHMHSVIGNKCHTLLYGKSDGVVPVSSAIEPRAESELYLKSTHTQLNDDVEAIEEVIRILQQHLEGTAIRGNSTVVTAFPS